MSPEESLFNLDSSYKAHLKEQEIINQFTLVLQKKAKDLVSEHFASEINRLSSDGYRALEVKIYNSVSNLAVEISNVFYHHTEGC